MRQGAKARGEELRGTLLDAAERRLAGSGLAGLTVRQLATDAACGAGTINYVFGSLDNLILAANQRTLVQIAATMEAAIHQTGAAPRPILMAALALAYLDYATAHRARWAALFAHQIADGGAVPVWYADQRDALMARIATVLGCDRQTAQAVFEAVHGVVSLGVDQKLGSGTPDDLRPRVLRLVALLSAGLDRPVGGARR